MKSRKDRKLRSFLIDKELQLKLISYNLIYICLSIFVVILIVLLPLVLDMVFSEDLETQYGAVKTLLLLVRQLLPSLIAMFWLVLLHQILVTHRICGPLVNFQNTLKRIKEGDLTRKVNLRPGDYLGKEAKEINEMIDRQARFISGVRANNDKLILGLHELLPKIEDLDSRKKVEAALDTVNFTAQLIKKELYVFRL